MRFRFSKINTPNTRINIRVMILIIFILLTLAISQSVASAPALQARQFEPGDVLVSASPGQVLWYDRNGKFIQILQSKLDTQIGGLAISPFDQNLYVADRAGLNIGVFNPFAQFISALTPKLDRGSSSLVFDMNGNMYVGDITTYGHILKIDRSGTQVADFNIDFDAANTAITISRQTVAYLWLDLAVDQRTLFYSTTGRTIKKFDVANNVQLKDFAVLPLPDAQTNSNPLALNLRLLYPGDGSGGLLIANASDIKRLDQFGNVIQIYDISKEDSWLTLSLDPDGTSFWSSSGTRIYKFDIASGNLLLNFDAGADIPEFSQTNAIWGLVVVNAPLAAQPTPTPTATLITPSPTFITSTSTITMTPSVTRITPTLTLIPPTTPPYIVPTRIPSPGGIPLWIIPLILVMLFVFVLGIAGIVWLVRSIRTKPKPYSVKPLPTVKVHGHADVGRQTLKPGSHLSLPKLHLRAGEGVIHYKVKTEDRRHGLGDEL